MTLARSKVYWYFPIYTPPSIDISAGLVELSMDQVTWVTADHTDPPAEVIATYVADCGVPAWATTPQWVRYLTGPATSLALSYGQNTVHGRLTDTPETPYFRWTVNVPND